MATMRLVIRQSCDQGIKTASGDNFRYKASGHIGTKNPIPTQHGGEPDVSLARARGHCGINTWLIGPN